MMKHIAVFLRGHVRTWLYIHPVVFDFYNSIAENIDYYFTTWMKYDMSFEPVERTFEGKNLIKLLVVPNADGEHYTSWKGPAWLNFRTLPYKHKREREVTYDAVFDTRPDIIYKLTDKFIHPPEPNTMYTTGFVNQSHPERKTPHIGVDDHFFMMPSNVFDIMCERHCVLDLDGPHTEIKRFADECNIQTNALAWVQAVISRPTDIDTTPNVHQYFSTNENAIHNVSQRWFDTSKEKKLEILSRHAISPADYMTDSFIAKL